MNIYKHTWKNCETVYINSADGQVKVQIAGEALDRTAYIWDLVVYPHARGRRHGSLLLRLAVQQARIERADVAVIYPDCEQWVLDWYERFGFKRDIFFDQKDGTAAWSMDL